MPGSAELCFSALSPPHRLFIATFWTIIKPGAATREPSVPATSVGRPYCRSVGPRSTPPQLSAPLRSRWSTRRRREGAARTLGRPLALAAWALPVRMGRRRRSAPAKHSVSSSHPGHPTPGWELRVLGTGARRGADTVRCSHEGAASTRPQSLSRGTVAIPEGQSPGQSPATSGVVGSQGSPKALDLPSSPRPH